MQQATSEVVKRSDDGALIVPVLQHNHGVVGYQIISHDGSKKYSTGTERRGSYYLVGAYVENETILIAVDYETAVSLNKATGLSCYVAFDAANLLHVAKLVRKLYPHKKIVICADVGHPTEKNPGLINKLVKTTANEVSGIVVTPQFINKKGRTNFKDMQAEQGLDVVKKYVLAQIKKHVDLSGDAHAWENNIVKNDKGTPLPILANIYEAFKNHPNFKNVIAYNEHTSAIECVEPPLWSDEGKRSWTDRDDSQATMWCSRVLDLITQTRLIAEAVETVAYDNVIHPVRAYLNKLEWDDKERLPGLMTNYFGATGNEDPNDTKKVEQEECYKKLVGIKTLVGAVARVMNPGCKNDCVLIIEGDQGTRKSTALNILAGEWFLDTPISIGDKDAFIAIQGQWIVELAELDSFNRAESTRAKAFFSSRIDKYRAHYGRRVKSHPRQCIFIGTTNQHEYLIDETGNRRYWPVSCGKIDISALKRDRDQLWAEALHLYKSGVKHWVTDAESSVFNQAQAKRQLDDPWLDVIEQWACIREEVTINDVLNFALDIKVERIDRRMSTRVGKCLHALGYVKRQRYVDKSRGSNAKSRYYYIKLGGV